MERKSKTTKYFDSQDREITKEQKNMILDHWDSFYPGHPGHTIKSVSLARVYRTDPKTNEEKKVYSYTI